MYINCVIYIISIVCVVCINIYNTLILNMMPIMAVRPYTKPQQDSHGLPACNDLFRQKKNDPHCFPSLKFRKFRRFDGMYRHVGAVHSIMEKTISREGMEGKSLMKAEKKRRFAGLPGFTLRVMGKCSHDGIGAYAAQSAFFELMSVFPFLMLLLQLMRFAPVSQESLLFMVDNIFPDYLLPAMHEILQELYSSSFGLVSVSVITTLWAASKAMHAVTTGLDRICRAQEVRNWIVIRLWALLYTCLLAIIIIIAVTSAVFWQKLRDFLVHYRPKGVPLHMYNMVLRSIYLIFLLTLVVAIMYKAFPHKRLSFMAQLPGAFFCAVSLYVFSNIITVYLNSFNGFSMYGSLTTLILVMFWLYFCNYFIMLGAEINEVRRQELLREEEEFNDGKEEEAEVL